MRDKQQKRLIISLFHLAFFNSFIIMIIAVVVVITIIINYL